MPRLRVGRGNSLELQVSTFQTAPKRKRGQMADHVLYEKDRDSHVARIILNRPEKLNAMTETMYDLIAEALDDAENDDKIKVIAFSGSGSAFSAGQDLNEVYDWYKSDGDDDLRRRRPSQRRRLTVDRRTFGQYERISDSNKITVASAQGVAFGGGFEFLLASDISVVAEGTQLGMPAARLLGPVLGSLHLFFWRLGPVLSKDLLLTGRKANVSEPAFQGMFTRIVPEDELEAETEKIVSVIARMPADGLVIAKEAYKLISKSPGMGLSHVANTIFHAFGTNLSFESDEFNFVKVRGQEGATKAFDLRDEFFEGTAAV